MPGGVVMDMVVMGTAGAVQLFCTEAQLLTILFHLNT